MHGLNIIHHRQNGISLVIVLIFLTVLSMLGITLMQGSTLGARIARNESDRNVAFQAAEAALRDAENDIRYKRSNGQQCTSTDSCRTEPLNGSNFGATCTAGLCTPGTAATPIWDDSANWSTAGRYVVYGTYTGATAIPLVSQPPRYLIEYFRIGESDILRITAQGYGLNSSTKTMLQTTLKVRLL
jgi:type IV pilus assembly protein PilX